jgi:hypothetical protein
MYNFKIILTKAYTNYQLVYNSIVALINISLLTASRIPMIISFQNTTP